MVKYMFLKNVHIYSLIFLNFVHVVLFDVSKSPREYQSSDSRATRFANFLGPLPTMMVGRLENFPLFYENKRVTYGVNPQEGVTNISSMS